MSAVPMLSYVYGVCRPADLPDDFPGTLAGVAGVAGGPVRTVVDGGLAAVVSSVPEDEFDETGFRAQLEDLRRLEAIARAHHAVVDHCADRATVLPLRLATVYRDDAKVTRMLHEARETFTALLARLDGRAEWGIKVYARPTEPAQGGTGTAPAGAAGDGEALGPGRAYLRQRRARRTRQQDAYRAAAEAADRIAALADAYHADLAPHRPQSGELATGEGENVSNVSYLLPRDRGEEFGARAAQLCRSLDGVRLEVTGPWAPYSFAGAPPLSATEAGRGR